MPLTKLVQVKLALIAICMSTQQPGVSNNLFPMRSLACMIYNHGTYGISHQHPFQNISDQKKRSTFVILGPNFVIWKVHNINISQKSFIVDCICTCTFFTWLSDEVNCQKDMNYRLLIPLLFFFCTVIHASGSESRLLSESELLVIITVADFLWDLFSIRNSFEHM